MVWSWESLRMLRRWKNAHLAEGYEYVSIITTKIDAELMEKFHKLGVKMISTRTIGYDHVVLKRRSVWACM